MPQSEIRKREMAYDSVLRVLVDMDMVLCDFETSLLSQFREKYPDDPYIPLENRVGFYARDQYAKLRDDLPDKIRSIYNAEGFFLNLPEIPGACSALKEMSQMEGVDVFICTSPLTSYEYCLKEKCQWVENHLGSEWVDKIILLKDKTLVQGHLLIDDRPDIKGSLKRPSWTQVVFTACNNRTSNLKGKKRLENWTDGSWRDLIEDFKKRV